MPPSARVLADILFAPLRKGEGVRIGIVGDSGCGKTWAARWLLAEYLRRVPTGFALVHDDTGPIQFQGQVRGFVADLARRPLAPSPAPRVAVFRGDATAGVGVDPESLAVHAWRCVKRSPPTPMLVLLDELERSASAGHWKHPAGCAGGAKCVCTLPRLFSFGRRSCASVFWTTQSPMAAPRAAFEQSSALLCVHLGGRGLRYLRDLDYLDGGAETAIAGQPGALQVAAGAVPGYVLLQRSATWDGRIWRL